MVEFERIGEFKVKVPEALKGKYLRMTVEGDTMIIFHPKLIPLSPEIKAQRKKARDKTARKTLNVQAIDNLTKAIEEYEEYMGRK
jgi:hypothetical protein